MDEKTVGQGEKTTQQTQLAAAYVAAWGAIDNVVKNADNPHFGSSYADLGAVLDTVRPVFAANGLALLTAPGVMDDKGNLSMSWSLIHKGGGQIAGVMSLPIGAKATAQAGGSCLTYMRRYLTASVGGIAQVDDDGNAASAPPPAKKTKAAPSPSASTPPSGEPSYAETKEALIAKIKGTQDIKALEALKPELAAFGDQAVADEYAAHKRTLKATK